MSVFNFTETKFVTFTYKWTGTFIPVYRIVDLIVTYMCHKIQLVSYLDGKT